MKSDGLPTTKRAAFCIDRWIISGDAVLSSREKRWIWTFLALGVLARLIRFALRFPLWPDEAFLSASFLNRGYLDMLRPLEYHQVCPLLFLWGELTVVKLLGFSEYTLRLFPLMCSFASLALFLRVAGRLLRGTSLLMAIGIFSVGYPGIRFGPEVKPYGCDLLVTLALLAMLLQWQQRPQRTRWLWGLAILMPLAIGLSYPAVFVAGAVSLTIAFLLKTIPGARGRLAWLACNLSLVASFLAFYFAGICGQNVELEGMQHAWQAAFPPLESVSRFLGWLAMRHIVDLGAYPVDGLAVSTFLCYLAGLAILCRRRQFLLPVLCGAALGLNFIAAVLHRYPYGGHIKFMLYLMPLICLLAGLGAGELLERLAQRWGRCSALTLAAMILLAVIPIGSIVRDFAHPGKCDDDIRFCGFARWFWPEVSRGAELVLLDADPATRFAPLAFEWDYSSQYVCLQRIYTPPRAHPGPSEPPKISAGHPLRCVRYRAWGYADDESALRAWFDSMNRRYDLAAYHEYPISRKAQSDGEPPKISSIVVYEFALKKPLAAVQK